MDIKIKITVEMTQEELNEGIERYGSEDAFLDEEVWVLINQDFYSFASDDDLTVKITDTKEE